MQYKLKNRLFLLVVDVLLFYLTLFLSLDVRYGAEYALDRYKDFVFSSFFLILIWLFLLYILDFYSLQLRPREFSFFRSVFIFCVLATISGMLYFYLQPELKLTPRAILILHIILFAALFVGWRSLLDLLIVKKIPKEKVIFIGTLEERPEVNDLIKHFEKTPSSYKVVEVFTETKKENKLSAFKEKLQKLIKNKKVKKLIVSHNSESFKEVFSAFPQLKLESFARFYEENTGKVSLSALGDPQFLEDFYREKDKSFLVSKRIFDIVFSSIGFVFLVILFPFIAIAIKMESKGPVFFIQERIGENRRIFWSYKFRSMYSSDENSQEVWRERDKNEITKVGKFLRFTHLDELPQFYNILIGDISFVGPRPEWEKLGKEFENKIPFYFLRYKVQPGFTGWAQINFPPSQSVEEAQEKFQYDLYYIKRRSFFLDISIFLKSLRKLFG